VIWGDLEVCILETMMFEKYPSISPYTYCANNPMIMIDEKGEFPIKIHELLVSNAIKGTNLEQYSKQLLFGTGTVADIYGVNISSNHLDGMNYSQLKNGYNNAIVKFYSNIKNKWFENAGRELHKVADFYAHSNYIELYEEYAKAAGKEFNADNIPTFREGMKIPEFNKLLKEKLHTGTFGGTGFVILDGIIDKFNRNPKSHNMMCKDDAETESGKQPFGNTTRYEAVFRLAQKDINQLFGKDE
jgi:hypothetical protein